MARGGSWAKAPLLAARPATVDGQVLSFHKEIDKYGTAITEKSSGNIRIFRYTLSYSILSVCGYEADPST